MLEMIGEIGKYAAFVGIGLVSVVTIASFAVFLRHGPGRIAELRRLGLTVPNWWKGELPKRDAGSNIHTLEGLQIEVHDGELKAVKQTRAISSEI